MTFYHIPIKNQNDPSVWWWIRAGHWRNCDDIWNTEVLFLCQALWPLGPATSACLWRAVNWLPASHFLKTFSLKLLRGLDCLHMQLRGREHHLLLEVLLPLRLEVICLVFSWVCVLVSSTHLGGSHSVLLPLLPSFLLLCLIYSGSSLKSDTEAMVFLRLHCTSCKTL